MEIESEHIVIESKRLKGKGTKIPTEIALEDLLERKGVMM